MYMFRLVALSLLLSATPAAAGDRASQLSAKSAASSPDGAAPRPPLSDRYANRGPPSARMPLVPNMDVGVGLYSVSGHFVRDRERNGREPILGTTGRDNRIAAVGLSLRF